MLNIGFLVYAFLYCISVLQHTLKGKYAIPAATKEQVYVNVGLPLASVKTTCFNLTFLTLKTTI